MNRAQRPLPPGLAAGLPRKVTEAEAISKRTRPPRRFTEATLLTAMETAGRTLDDKELSAAMRETGLGTPATRAETRRACASSRKLPTSRRWSVRAPCRSTARHPL